MLIYGILSTIVFIIAMPFVFAIRKCIGKPNAGLKAKFGFINSPFNKDDDIIMLHGVSVGEVIALENLAKKIKETFPNVKLAVTTGTKTGQEIAQKKYEGIADFITYFPFDIPFCVDRFLKRLNPKTVLIAETEIWPYFAYACKKRNIPISIINGRISDSTFNSYLKVKFFFKSVFKNFAAIYTQSMEDKNKYIAIGADEGKVEVMGNLKFDVKRKDADIQIGQEGFRIIIAGSTHAGEDEIVLKVFKNLKSKYSDVKLLLAPRHPKRVPDIENLMKNMNLTYGLRSRNDKFTNYDIIILDTLGELGKMYSICHFAFIGGSFNKTGGHNPLEAVVYDKPAITGPSIHNFKDIYAILNKTNAGQIVNTPEELENYQDKLLADNDFYENACNDCKTVFEAQQGALNFVISKLASGRIDLK
jgi:3-deoxy-D-manno-octulosonic-acid transferase